MHLIDLGLREVLLYAFAFTLFIRFTLITIGCCGIWSGISIIAAAQGELYYYIFGLVIIGLSIGLLLFKLDSWREKDRRKRVPARAYSDQHDKSLL